MPANGCPTIRKLAARMCHRASLILSIARPGAGRAGRTRYAIVLLRRRLAQRRLLGGEYPNGFTMTANLTIPIRSRTDQAAPKSLPCRLKRGATYHVWTQSRVASDKRQFVSYTRIETYQLKADYKNQLMRP